MAEKITPVEVVTVEYLCDECGEAMKCVGSYPMVPPTYIHQCSNAHVFKSQICYPTTRYIPKEGV